jgi:hypothetical protein
MPSKLLFQEEGRGLIPWGFVIAAAAAGTAVINCALFVKTHGVGQIS